VWRNFAPATAAREVHTRIAALSPALRSAALAWVRPEPELAAELEAAPEPSGKSPRPLAGIPCLLKDLFDVAGVPTRAGSSFLADVRPTPGDSTLVRRLRELGAGLVGKTHLVEFAAGLTGENRTFGDCLHPYFPDRLAGGSSSGSAALVAAGVVPFAIGTDTGGSVRVPAAFCGVFGFRGTPQHAFIRDAVPLSPTCDTAGWFTANVADMQTAIKALVGDVDPAPRSPRGVFLSARDLFPPVDTELDRACVTAAANFSKPVDHDTRALLLTAWRDTVETYATLVTHEAWQIHRAWLGPYREHYDPGIWQRFTDAGQLPAEKLAHAEESRQQIRRAFAAFFERHDFLVLPCAPVPALTKAQCTPEMRRSILTFTAPASLAGLPCLTVPVRLPSGLTAGLQVIASKENSPTFPWLLRGAGL